MTDDQIKSAFENLTRYKRGTDIALNKPLLLLFMLGKYWHHQPRLLRFKNINKPAKHLFGVIGMKPVSNIAVWMPFWHMKTETAIWELTGAEELVPKKVNWGRPDFAEAYNSNLHGGFTENLYRRIINDKVFLLDLVFSVLQRYFPKHLHMNLLESVGIPEQVQPAHFEDFINEVLQIYQHRCAVCEFTGELGNMKVGLQVAHIKWPLAGGPDDCDNGLALCTPHRELFDVGAFTLSQGDVISVSRKYTERGGIHLLNDYEGRKIAKPTKRQYYPREEYVKWHTQQVFR